MALEIFISHRHEERELAENIADILRYGDIIHGGNPKHEAAEIDIFLSENILGGKDWRKSIEEKIESASIFVLLYTNPKENWEWCFYEAGMFTDLNEKDPHKRKKIIVFHNGIKEPGPVKHLQMIPAVHKNVENFLRKFYSGSSEIFQQPIPVVQGLAEDPDELTTCTNILVEQLLDTKITKYHYHHSIVLNVPKGQVIEDGQLPNDLVVKTKIGTLQSLFGITKEVASWGLVKWSFEEAARKSISDPDTHHADQRWLAELGRAIVNARMGATPRAMSPFRSPKDSTLWRPILQRVDGYGAEEAFDRHRIGRSGDFAGENLKNIPRIEAHIQFVETDAGVLTDVPNDSLGDLITALTMARRFRFEVLRRFRGHLLWSQHDDERFKKSFSELRHCVETILRDADVMNLVSPEQLSMAFEKPEEIAELHDCYKNWQSTKAEIFAQLDEFESVERTQRDRISAFLDGAEKLNYRFMILATKRWNELLTREYQMFQPRFPADGDAPSETDMHPDDGDDNPQPPSPRIH